MSIVVPSGHIQPQKALPKTKGENKISSAIRKTGSKKRPASWVTIAVSGSAHKNSSGGIQG